MKVNRRTEEAEVSALARQDEATPSEVPESQLDILMAALHRGWASAPRYPVARRPPSPNSVAETVTWFLHTLMRVPRQDGPCAHSAL